MTLNWNLTQLTVPNGAREEVSAWPALKELVQKNLDMSMIGICWTSKTTFVAVTQYLRYFTFSPKSQLQEVILCFASLFHIRLTDMSCEHHLVQRFLSPFDDYIRILRFGAWQSL